MKKFCLLIFTVLLCLGVSNAQTKYYVFEPKVLEALKEGSIDFYLSDYRMNDSILVKNEKDELVQTVALNTSSGTQILNVMRKVGNIKIYAHRASDGNPAHTVCFSIRGVLDNSPKHFCVSKFKFLWIKINMKDNDEKVAAKLFFPLKNTKIDSIRINIRHDLGHGRKTRADSILVNQAPYKLSTDGLSPKSNCEFTLANRDEIFFEINFAANKVGDEKIIHLVVVVTAISTGKRASKPIKLYRKEPKRYQIILE